MAQCPWGTPVTNCADTRRSSPLGPWYSTMSIWRRRTTRDYRPGQAELSCPGEPTPVSEAGNKSKLHMGESSRIGFFCF